MAIRPQFVNASSDLTQTKCGSGLARECGVSVNKSVTVTPHSRASPLPQGFCCVSLREWHPG
ncbi:MAG TPA: hypothetical protein DIW86_12045 [Pseudomonas sp.]|nr:hypothetical protein [Pseudomonas sp.]